MGALARLAGRTASVGVSFSRFPRLFVHVRLCDSPSPRVTSDLCGARAGRLWRVLIGSFGICLRLYWLAEQQERAGSSGVKLQTGVGGAQSGGVCGACLRPRLQRSRRTQRGFCPRRRWRRTGLRLLGRRKWTPHIRQLLIPDPGGVPGAGAGEGLPSEAQHLFFSLALACDANVNAETAPFPP